jgi:hypothetical protein
MTNANYIIEKLNIQEAKWYGANVECYKVRYNGFAPIEKFAALDKKGRYTDNPSKGYIHGNGNLGTVSMLLTDISKLEKK